MFTALKAVNYFLAPRHGNAPISAVGFVAYGLILGGGMDRDIKRGHEFGRMAVELAERSKDPSIICRLF